jgi:NTE family protein
VGILEEFEKANIPIDIIVGCSAGSLVGVLYADHPDAEYVKSVLVPVKSRWFMDINLWNCRYGLCEGRSMATILEENLYATCFDELQIPFYAAATDLYSGQLVTIGCGELIPAIQASTAIPFVYQPVQMHGRMLVDGGVSDPVPVRIARSLGAEYVIAVDLQGMLPKTIPSNLFCIASRSMEIVLLWHCETCTQDADIIIRPDLVEYGTFDEAHEQIYEAGRDAAREAIPAILEFLKEKNIQKGEL